MKKISVGFLIVLSLITACTKNEDIKVEKQLFEAWEISRSLDGKYDVVSFTSGTPVDLNHDGIPSKDLLHETDQWQNREKYFIHFVTDSTSGKPKLFYQKIFIWVPLPNVITDVKTGRYLFTGYGFANVLARYSYDEASNNLKILRGDLGEGELLSANVSNAPHNSPDYDIHVTFKQYYPITSNDWEELTIDAVYRKQK